MARFLVFGSKGQLGTELLKVLEARGESVVGVDREECDVTSATAVRRAFETTEPEFVFNAATFSDVDQAESVRRVALQTNGVGAGIVAAHCREAGATNVFFSSHYVFGDGHHAPIDEARTPEPLNNYGKSMLFGEQLVARNCPRSFVIRSSALYSQFGTNVVRQLTQIALAGKKTISMVDDETIAPTPAALVAETAIDIALSGAVYGTYHASTTGECSWYDFVSTFLAKLELGVEVHAISAERWGAPARRPRYSVLDNMMLRTQGHDHFPNWQTALDRFIHANGEEIIWSLS